MSVIKPDSVISCVGENDVYTYPIDAVYDGDKIGFNALSSINDGGWYPKTPSGDWKTWLIYKFNRPKNITKINFTIFSYDFINWCRVAKNIDTSYNTETVSIPGSLQRTTYNNLNVIQKDRWGGTEFTFYTIGMFGFGGINQVVNKEVTGYRENLNNIDNLLFVFEKPVNIIEIECIGENIPLPYLKSEKSELTVKNLDNNTSFNINSTDKIYPKISLSNDKFQITSQITDRIFIYDNTNKLVHITDYIPKGTTQNVTIDYTLGINSIKSSITPVNPLPVPNFYKSNLSSDCINSNQYFSCPSSPDLICPDNYIIDTINTGPQTIKYRCKNIYSTSENSLRGLGNQSTSETTSDNSGFAKSKTHWLSDGIRGINFTKGNGNTVLTGSANGNISNFSCDNGKINGFNGGIFTNTGNIILLKTFCALPTIK
jgi:hypothetical protein